MTNEEYQDMLGRLPLRKAGVTEDLFRLHKKIFGHKPTSKLKKSVVVEKLYKKFIEMNADNPDAEKPLEKDLEEIPAEVKTSEVKTRAASRRGLIIQLIQEGIWDIKSLAEALNVENPEWPLKKNKAAISGTMADLRKNKGWIIKTDDDGKILATVPS